MILLHRAPPSPRWKGNAEFGSAWWPQLALDGKPIWRSMAKIPKTSSAPMTLWAIWPTNANLSVKAILAIAAFGELNRMRRRSSGCHR